MHQHGARLHGHEMACAARVLTRHAVDLLRRRQIAAPVLRDHCNIALETTGGKNYTAGPQFRRRAQPQVQHLHADHFAVMHQQVLRHRVPAELNVGIAQRFQVQRPCQIQATPICHVKPGYAIAVARDNSVETDAESGYPVINQLTRLLCVETGPLRMAVHGPLHPVAIRKIRRVLETQLRLHGRADNGHTTRLDAVPTEHGIHIHDQHVGATVRGINGRR